MHVERTLLLVRHGETTWNKEGRFQGQSDIPLSEVGRAQARALRERLAAHAHLFDPAETAVVSSDLLRAHETAEIAFGLPGRAIERDVRLREFRYGVFEGRTRDEIDVEYPGLMDEWSRGVREFAMTGGESRADVHARSHRAVTAWLSNTVHRHMVVVAHGGVMRQLLHTCFASSAAPPDISYANAVTHVVHVRGDAWHYAGAL